MTRHGDPVLRLGRPVPGLADPAVLARVRGGLQRNSFASPREHNASIRMRYGRGAALLNRDEVVRLYGWDAALELFPNP